MPPPSTRRCKGPGLYYVACVCLLIAAAALRFYELSEHSLWHDEAVAANNARGTFSETVVNTRFRNSSPILYPLFLYMIQKVESSSFTVRVVPAIASVLTVACFLFLLPRVGVSRMVAFSGGLLATVSVEAIRHAQDVREYSIDAFVAVLMIIGLLSYLRDGKRVLLCVSLFIAPLVQYGLVLFGAAVIGTMMIKGEESLPNPFPGVWKSQKGWIWNSIKERCGLVWPSAFFMAGSTISFLITLRYQFGSWGPSSYLSSYFYQGKYFDIISILLFVASQMWQLLNYHMSTVIAIWFLVGFGFYFHGTFSKGRRLDAVAILFLFTIAIAGCAAVLGIYPFGGIRQSIYLSPVLFLTAGLSLHATVNALLRSHGGGWLRPVLLGVTIGIITGTGLDTIKGGSQYWHRQNIKLVLATLKDLVRDEDVVYIASAAIAAVNFHERQKPDNYHDGMCKERHTDCECFADMITLITPNTQVMFLVFSHDGGRNPKPFETLGPSIHVENVIQGESSLWSVTPAHILKRRWDEATEIDSDEPRKRMCPSVFN